MKDQISDEVKDLHSQVKGMLVKKMAEEDILKKLRESGIKKDYAILIIENAKEDIDKFKNFKVSLFIGLFLIVGGIIINILSYRIAEAANSIFFYLFWGIIAVGIVTVVKAYVLFKS
ncbi:MAG: hypothetical protein QM725_07015 [Lacibacter sp.]